MPTIIDKKLLSNYETTEMDFIDGIDSEFEKEILAEAKVASLPDGSLDPERFGPQIKALNKMFSFICDEYNTISIKDISIPTLDVLKNIINHSPATSFLKVITIQVQQEDSYTSHEWRPNYKKTGKDNVNLITEYFTHENINDDKLNEKILRKEKELRHVQANINNKIQEAKKKLSDSTESLNKSMKMTEAQSLVAHRALAKGDTKTLNPKKHRRLIQELVPLQQEIKDKFNKIMEHRSGLDPSVLESKKNAVNAFRKQIQDLKTLCNEVDKKLDELENFKKLSQSCASTFFREVENQNNIDITPSLAKSEEKLKK